MADKVNLILAKPEKVVKKGEYWGVVLPTTQDNLTIIRGRAPSLIYLNAGVVKLLGSPDKVMEKIYISNGVAEVAGDTCTVSCEYVLTAGDVSLENIKVKLDAAKREREKAFYQEIFDDLTAFDKERLS